MSRNFYGNIPISYNSNRPFPLISIDSTFDLWIASDLISTRNVRKLPVIGDDKVVEMFTQLISLNTSQITRI